MKVLNSMVLVLTLVSFMTACAHTGPQVYYQRTTCMPGETCQTTATETDTDGTVAGVPAHELVRQPGTHTRGDLMIETPQGPVSFQYEVHDTPPSWTEGEKWGLGVGIAAGVIGIVLGGLALGGVFDSGGGDLHIDRTVHLR